MPWPKNGIPPSLRPYTDLIVTVEPIGNCVCGLKEPLVLWADASGVARSAPKAKRSIIPVVVDFVIFCIKFINYDAPWLFCIYKAMYVYC